MKFGKFKLIHIFNAVLCLGCGLSLADNIVSQSFGSFIMGISIGVYSVLVPQFINETAPSELKGPFGAMSQCMITSGILVQSLVGLLFPYFFTDGEYRNCKITQYDH